MKTRENTGKTWKNILREAAASSGKTCYRLALDAKIGQTSLRKFLAGQTGLSLAAAEGLAGELGLELREKGRRAGR